MVSYNWLAWVADLFRKEKVRLVIMCIIIAAAYIPTLSGEFILDDRPFVKDNPYLREFHSLTSYLSQEDGISSDSSGQWHSGYYRPLVNVTYTLDFKIWGMKGSGFRVTNLVLHLITCLVLYACLKLVTTGGAAGAYFSVLLFGLHPANTEAVAWVTSRNNILVAFFSLASFYFYIRREKESKKWQGWLSLTCFAMALFSKEFAIMLFPLVIIYDLLLKGMKKAFRERVWGYFAFLVIIVAYMLLRRAVLQHFMPGHITLEHVWQSIYFAPFLLIENLRIIFIPFGLHNFMITYPSSYFGKEAILGFAGTGLLLWLLWRWRDNKILVFSFISFLIALIPVLNVFPTSAYSLVSMRWLYFPMIFLTFCAAPGFDRLARVRKRILAYGLPALALVYCVSFTYILNDNLWKSDEDFFSGEVFLFGNHFYAGDLARIYQMKGDYQKARQYYQIAERHRSPNRSDLFMNYAALLVETNKPETALAYLERAQAFDLGKDSLGAIYNNRGAAYYRLNDYEKAIRSFQKATILAPAERTYLMNLAAAYEEAGRSGSAAAVYRKYLDLDSKAMLVKKKLGIVYTRMGDFARAEEILREIPDEARAQDPMIQELLKQFTQRQGRGSQSKEQSSGTP